MFGSPQTNEKFLEFPHGVLSVASLYKSFCNHDGHQNGYQNRRGQQKSFPVTNIKLFLCNSWLILLDLAAASWVPMLGVEAGSKGPRIRILNMEPRNH